MVEGEIQSELSEHEDLPQKTFFSTVTVSALLAARLIKGHLASWVQKQRKHIKGKCHSITQQSKGF